MSYFVTFLWSGKKGFDNGNEDQDNIRQKSVLRTWTSKYAAFLENSRMRARMMDGCIGYYPRNLFLFFPRGKRLETSFQLFTARASILLIRYYPRHRVLKETRRISY